MRGLLSRLDANITAPVARRCGRWRYLECQRFYSLPSCCFDGGAHCCNKWQFGAKAQYRRGIQSSVCERGYGDGVTLSIEVVKSTSADSERPPTSGCTSPSGWNIGADDSSEGLTESGPRASFSVGASAIGKDIIPFVNRCAEALDLFAILLEPTSGKASVALGYQLMGSGKTILGLQATSVLCRPRESDAEEEHVAGCLMRSRTLSEFSEDTRRLIMSKARARLEDETLVARTLREILTRQGVHPVSVDLMKEAVTVVVDLSTGDPRSYSNLSTFVSHAIYRSLGLPSPPDGVAAACRAVSQHLGGRTVLLVLDEIGSLVDDRYRHMLRLPEAASAQKLRYTAMLNLREVIDYTCGNLEGEGRWMVYCTGRNEWLAMHALAGPSSPLRTKAVLLAPLTAKDVLEMIQGTPSIVKLFEDAAVRRQLADEIARRSGGVGRVIYTALQALHSCGNADTKNVDKTIRLVESKLMRAASCLFPRATTQLSDIEDPALLSSIGRLLLEGQPFEEDAVMLTKNNQPVLTSSVLTDLGFNFVPAPNSKDARLLLPMAGTWHLMALPEVLLRSDGAEALQLLHALARAEKGCGRGSYFEALCIVQTIALIERCVPKSGRRPFGDIMPFLRGTSAETATVGRLRPRMLPKVTEQTKPLTEVQKTSDVLISSLETINPRDLRWFLYKVLGEDELGIPRGQSASQDWFIRAKGAVVGFCSKLVDRLTPRNVGSELKKRPTFVQGDDPYVLVVLCAALGPKLKIEMSNKAAMVPNDMAEGEGSSRDVIVVSPTHKDGLDALLTIDVGDRFRSSAASDDGILQRWFL